MKTLTLDQRINALAPGHSVEIGCGKISRVTVMRSGDGKTLKFIRHSGDTSTVIKTCRF